MIYLASPYSHPDAAVRDARFKEACRAAAAMMRRGELVFSPIAHGHPLTEFGLPGDWGYWERHSHAMLLTCSELRVLTLEGWKDSRGVSAEIDIANDMGIRVTFVEAEAACDSAT
jgi:hypothetical protein